MSSQETLRPREGQALYKATQHGIINNNNNNNNSASILVKADFVPNTIPGTLHGLSHSVLTRRRHCNGLL